MKEEGSAFFKTGTGIAQYVSSERYDLQCPTKECNDLQYPTKECRREAGKPTKRAQARLKRIAR